MSKKKQQEVIELSQFELNKPFPLKDSSQSKLTSTHVIQRVDDIIEYFNEVYRVLKPNGEIQLSIPYYTSSRAWQDPTHKRMIPEAFFVYLNKEWREKNSIPYDIKCNFEVTNMNHAVTQEFVGKSQEAIQYAISHYWNVVSDLIVTLKKI